MERPRSERTALRSRGDDAGRGRDLQGGLHEDPSRAGVRVVAGRAHQGRDAVRGQRNGGTSVSQVNHVAPEQHASRLRPDTAASGVDPCPENVIAHHRSITVGGQRNREALFSAWLRRGVDQRIALLRPSSTTAGEHPYGPDSRKVLRSRSTRNECVAVRRQGNRGALFGRGGWAGAAGADQLVALLGPLAVLSGENPHRPRLAIAACADDGRVTVSGQCYGGALQRDWGNVLA
jgi:hypothetical protein